jgi:hypothetical protein
MGIIVGSARHDENGKYTGGKKGDQLQKSGASDTKGECSLQGFYVHPKGWFILRPVSKLLADNLAESMMTACDNKNIGYSQGCQRKTVDDICSLIPINVDCSKLVRDCIYHSSHHDVGNFTTASEVAVLEKSGLFEKHIAFKSQEKTPVYNGDVLVSQTKGHTVIVCTGSPRPQDKKYYPKYTGTTTSIVTALKSVGENDTSFAHRKKIASANGINLYVGTATQNTQLLKLLKSGKLVRV